MTLIPDPLALDALMHQVLNCVGATLDDAAVSLNPDRNDNGYLAPKFRGTEWAPNPVPDFGKAECGELLVYLNNLYPSMVWPKQDQSLPSCAPTTLVADISVRVTRCVPQLADNGTPPTNEAKSLAAQFFTIDALGMETALRCCVPTANGSVRKRRVSLTGTRPMQPADIGGTIVSALISLDEACSCGQPAVS